MRHRIIIFVLPVFLFLSMVIPHSLFAGEPGKLIQESNYASVQTKIITHTGAEVIADYRLFKNEGNRINDVSIDKGESYENITKPAVDPYIAVQDAYIQNRMKKIKE